MRELFAEKTGVSLRNDADMSIRLRALAHELGTLWTHAEWLRRQCFPQTADREALEYHAQIRGLERGSAVAATGIIRFEAASPPSEAIAVRSGIICLAPGEVEFKTVGEGIIPPGALYCEVAAEAVNAGASGNVPADRVIYMLNPPVGITACRNPQAFAGGVDAEADGELRERILGSYRRLPNGANTAYYESQALGVDGVCAVSVLPKRRGIGTVDVIISTDGGLPAPELVERVQATLSSQREICVSILTAAPEQKNIAVQAAVLAAEGYGSGDVKSRVRQAVQDYFNGRLLGRDVLLAELGSVIYGVEGVLNYRIVSPAADVAVERDELPVLQSVVVGDMG